MELSVGRHRQSHRGGGSAAFAMAGAVLFATISSASAQDAERAGGPLRFAGQTKDSVNFIVGPQQPPAGPFAIWHWRFLRNVTSIDAIAMRVTIDCRANTRQVTMMEGYKLGRYVNKAPSKDDAAAKTTPQAGSTFEAAQQEACRPNSFAKGQTAPDIRNARVVADRLMGVKTAAPSAPAPAAAPSPSVAGAPSPARCKAVALVLAAGHDQSIKVGKLLLAMGPENGASPEKMAEARKLVADSEAKLARSLAVGRRYASAPMPNEAQIAQLKKIKIVDLEKEFDACGGNQPATAQTKPAPVPAPAAPSSAASAPSPAQCRAVAEVIAEGHEAAVKTGKMLLTLGAQKNASQQDMAKVRTLVADAESKLARTRAVARRYASAPKPGAALVARLRDTKVSELDKTLDACAGNRPATAQAKPAPAVAAAPAAPPKPAADPATQQGWKVGWRSAPDFSDTYYEASQVDPSGKFALVYSCSKNYKVRSARIYTSIQFDNTASYSANVPLKVSIDGKPAQEFSFRFQRMPHYARVQGAGGRDLETVDATTRQDPKALDPFLALLRTAQSSIAISFFDKSMRFTVEPGSPSIARVHSECPKL